MLRNILSQRCSGRLWSARLASTAPEGNNESDIPANFQNDEEDEIEMERIRIEGKRNKSGLRAHHQRVLHNIRPFDESRSWAHDTVKYQRMMFGRYGLASGVDPRICFPTTQERQIREEYNRIAFPDTIQQMREKAMEQRRLEKEEIARREEQIEKKLAKLADWKRELHDRVSKREQEARVAKEKKERLVEEVRRHFGFKIDHRDDRFKEMLAQKEKEDKRKSKEARKQLREEKMISKLLDQDKKTKVENVEAPKSS